MEQLDLLDLPRIDTSDSWLKNPRAAFENWQRNTVHSDGFLYSERSIRQHCAMWHRFVDYLGGYELDVRTIQSDKLAHFLDSLLGKDGSPAEDSTKRRYLKLLSAVFEHLQEAGVRRSANPCTVLFKYFRPAPDRSPVALASQDDEKFVAMVLAEPARFWRDYRDQAMMVLIIGSGLYASEVINLEMDQIVLDADPPYINVAAHGKVPERKAPIVPFAREPLRQWLALRATLPAASEQIVFISGKGGKMLPATLYRKVQSILKANDTTLHPRGGFGPQVLRNSFLMRQLAKDKPIDVVKQWAGHVETKSTLRYRRLVVNPGGVEAE
ncbi:site-specific integrase [Noviherbaspirillum sp.]|uniref:tyrosine-type recombinase/integrase n=1 Tax=Noviherbaspirillum sp. TaxID=1926288 RepID=UPI002B4655BD|nr:site-specific integrase [Noviherbaspirillum sp.]HJV81411.1 site-specific integrase [Noviherbaspirillum sp.]